MCISNSRELWRWEDELLSIMLLSISSASLADLLQRLIRKFEFKYQLLWFKTNPSKLLVKRVADYWPTPEFLRSSSGLSLVLQQLQQQQHELQLQLNRDLIFKLNQGKQCTIIWAFYTRTAVRKRIKGAVGKWRGKPNIMPSSAASSSQTIAMK